jgi:ATP synthase F0 subunit b
MEISTIIAEVVGFLIVLFVLYRYVLPPLRRMTNNREEQIRQQVEDSRQARERLEDAQARFKQAIQEAEHEASRIRDDARADAERITQEVRQKAEEEAERIRRRGEEALENARLQVVRELKAELGGHSVALADRLVRQDLESDEAKHASVNAFLDELERTAQGSSSSRGASSSQGPSDETWSQTASSPTTSTS